MTGTSRSTILPLPFESSGSMPPWKTVEPIVRIALMSRTGPSVTQPEARRAVAAVERSSPQGADPVGGSAASEHCSVSGPEVVDQSDLDP